MLVPLRFNDEDRAIYAEATSRLALEDLPLPEISVRPGHNTDQARGYSYEHWKQFFNDRQLLTLGLLLREIMTIEERDLREQMICLFSSVLEFNNLFCSFKGEGTGAVRHMFSNHILKPERTPLENSVWGTEKSSGTFATLFESRLIKARRYLDEPFEVYIDGGLFGDSNSTGKVVASKPLRPIFADGWEDLHGGDASLLLLNGDSSRLPLPSKSVDAVVTDPPYFDFVHYSELSDFFYAWLAPALRSTYSNFDREDSSDTGEVQHKDPHAFARQLGAVFHECSRVLKDDGTLTFSFHHSRAEGWAAISEAITIAGMEVVAAHAVHGELRSSSPKSASNDPISLDAIMVCRKSGLSQAREFSVAAILERTRAISKPLLASNLKLSMSDLFVIAASQTLLWNAGSKMDYFEVRERLEALRPFLRMDPADEFEDSTRDAEKCLLGRMGGGV